MTEFIICGSAAAEAWPALFCNCRCCQEAFARGGKEIRTRTTYHLGDTVHIDFGPDICTQMQRFGLPRTRITGCPPSCATAGRASLWWTRRTS